MWSVQCVLSIENGSDPVLSQVTRELLIRTLHNRTLIHTESILSDSHEHCSASARHHVAVFLTLLSPIVPLPATIKRVTVVYLPSYNQSHPVLIRMR